MTQLQGLMQRHPGYAFATQYALADDGFDSIVSFHNYFDEVFPDKQVAARLHLVFHDGDGRETVAHAVEIAPRSAVQIDARALGVASSGIVAVAAIPEVDPKALSEGRLKIRAQIGTGFYITWDRDRRFRDTMHEWTDVSAGTSNSLVHYVGFSGSATPIEYGLVLMNSSTAAPTDRFKLTLRSSEGRALRPTVELPPLAAMGSRSVRLTECFPDIGSVLADRSTVVVEVRSTMRSPPLTAEWHASGDFHIHHI